MTIAKSKVGTTYKVVSVANDAKLNRFLSSLGLVAGAEVTVISKAGTNYILNVKDSRYAIDTALASQITVESLVKTAV